MAPPADATSVLDAQKRAPADLQAVADFLRGKNGPKVRRGVLNGKRVDYFKGKTAVRTLLGPAYAKLKKVPAVTNEEEAAALITRLLPFAFFLRVDRPAVDPPPPSGSPKVLQLAPQQTFDPAQQYAWFYDGSPLWSMLGSAAMVLVMLAGVMFPLWPNTLRVGVWYLSVGALGLIGAFIVLAIIRLIFWCFTKIFMSKAIWMFPNLFEDVGFVDSFIPLWAWDEPKKKKLRKVGEKRSKKERAPAAAAAAPAVAAAPAAAAPATAAPTTPAPAPTPVAASTGASTATAPAASAPRHRQAATVEEVEDEE
ncbi:Translocation protein SEC62 [Vanrija pseudolonga]|uniref:Translocation protein SEC62 n=1 Tax=Vanrija pseudolonga TaxID=143232 RepID=A0AAF0YAW9_9TREE|nr:Translocation protein SEC62 [Vanrija pseudolonga]